jgi:ribosomal protein L7/L12
MSDTDIEGLDTQDLAEQVAAALAQAPPMLPMPGSVKEAEKVVETEFKAHRSRLDAARKALAQTEKTYESAIKQASRDREQVGRPAKIASIGLVRTVTLTETTIKTPKGEFPLTPDVEARAEQHGNKQVVQGWVFKSDNDRREIYLHLHGPDWADVVPFPMKHASMQPKHLHEFAAKVSMAARNSDRSRLALDERVRSADARLRAATADRVALEAASEAFVAAAWDVRELKPATKNLDHLLSDADHGDRTTRRASETLAEVRTKVKELLTEAEAARHRIRQATAALPALEDIVTGDIAPAGPVNMTLMAAGSKPIHVIKLVREATGASLKDAKGLVERAPTTLLAEVDAATAVQLKSSLERVGASVLLEPLNVPQPIIEATPTEPPTTPVEFATATDSPGQPDVIAQIRGLGELREAGLITPDEFDAKKAELLGRL